MPIFSRKSKVHYPAKMEGAVKREATKHQKKVEPKTPRVKVGYKQVPKQFHQPKPKSILPHKPKKEVNPLTLGRTDSENYKEEIKKLWEKGNP